MSAVSIALLVFSLPTWAWADSLTISASAESFQLYEPIIVDLTLHLEPPYQITRTDPVEAARQQRRIRHSFVAELRDGDETLCSALLSGAPFTPLRSGQTDFHVTAIGCLGMQKSAKPQNEFLFWDRPGRFILVVRDRQGGMESNEIAIEITEPENHDAAELFQSGGLDALSLIHVQEYGEGAVPMFERLAKDYPGTVYGKLAKISLALRHADPKSLRSRHNEMKPEIFRALATDLQEAISLFKPGHPLRNRALFRLAHVEPATGAEGNSQRTLKKLSREAHDEYWIRAAEDWLKRAARTQKYDMLPSSDEATGRP